MTEEEKGKSFWSWFKKEKNKYLFLNEIDDEENDKLIGALFEQLQEVNENLYFEIGGHPDDDKVEFIISAEGNIEHFPAVEKLTSLAPKFTDWEIIAFKPAMGQGFKIKLDNHEFSPESTIFIPLVNKEEPEKVGLVVCYPDFEEEEKQIFEMGTYLMFDALLGEKSSALDIDYVEVQQTPDDISDYNFIYLTELESYINQQKGNSSSSK